MDKLVFPSLASAATLVSVIQDHAVILNAQGIGEYPQQRRLWRTQLLGNIDIAIHTENAFAAGKVSRVRTGGSNSSIMDKQLEMLNNVPGVNGLSQVVAQDFDITIKLPDDVRCTGGSTGNICTIHVEPTISTPQNIKSFKDHTLTLADSCILSGGDEHGIF
ncbi:hypothetical protein GGTG_04760 [Gaeumannomyces tritici R3-111a-1]|uniref:Uncharacterized protein n=1 Tax=Gaeumannomyces tritici (strain R3-111a-1) TaxID=644352 RepID=J3NU11_GAET3|nr:hypothetical protein GGTG_04760 [Gaeumannomyces tritici R3-111a-1]EJT79676.1 hypothetical protein GGTG_04760 [Gaeumannomyces tritici R3-111a-1]